MKEVNVRSDGQSLFEVIVALAISALVLVAIVSLSTTSVRNSTFSKNDSMASEYAQEATEWVRSQRDESWLNLTANIGSTKCIGNSPGFVWSASGPCTIGGTIFSRGVTLSYDSADPTNNTIIAVVTVAWTDGQGTHTVNSPTVYTNWRR